MNGQIDPRIYNVKTITSLKEITDVSDRVLNSSYGIFSYDNDETNRYVSHKVKFSTITDEALKKTWPWIEKLKNELQFFVENLWISYEPTYMWVNKSPILFHGPGGNYTYLSYNFHITPIFAYLIQDLESYVVSYLPEDNTYSYIYSYDVSPGLVNHNVLQDYVNNTIERILGVPNTPEAVEEAINSVQEFINWFKGYVSSDTSYGSLQYLINTIENKDEYIRQLSYAFTLETMNQINQTIDELDYNYTAPENHYFTGIKQVNGKITEITTEEVIGGEVDIDEDNNSITVGNIQYTLSKNSDGLLGLYQYIPLSLNVTNKTENFEIDTYPQTIALTVTASGTYPVISENGWTTSSGDYTVSSNSNSGKTFTASGTTGNSNDQGTFTITIKENTENNPIQKTATRTVKFDQKQYFLGYSTSSIFTFSNSIFKTNIENTFNSNNGGIFAKGLSLDSVANGVQHTPPSNIGPVYWYLVIPQTVNINTIYFGTGSQKALGQGGWKQLKINDDDSQNNLTIKQYSNNTQYNVYRSINAFSVGMNIQF